MNKPPLFKVVAWANPPPIARVLAVTCPACGADGEIECGDLGCLVIATIGLSIVFDKPGHVPPPNAMPAEIQCSACGEVFQTKGDV